jgi:hypothetical protein
MTGQGPQPADPDLAARFPGWDIERGTDGRLHAWLIGTDPSLTAIADDEAGLRARIREMALGTLL